MTLAARETYTDDDGNTTTMGVTLRLTHTASFTSALLQNQLDQQTETVKASDQYIDSKQNAFSVNE